MRPIIITVRAEPGASATAARVRAAGCDVLAAPLFAAAPMSWEPQAPQDFDRLLFTSSNALRHGGAGLSAYHRLPCWCVGAKTAATAAAAGFAVERTGDSDAATLLADPAAAGRRWLWLAGARHQDLPAPDAATLTVVPVYAMTPLPVAEPLQQALACPAILLVHSAEAARHVRTLVQDPALHHLVAISSAVVDAAGPGWRSVSAARTPDDREMVAIAAALCQKARHE